MYTNKDIFCNMIHSLVKWDNVSIPKVGQIYCNPIKNNRPIIRIVLVKPYLCFWHEEACHLANFTLGNHILSVIRRPKGDVAFPLPKVANEMWWNPMVLIISSKYLIKLMMNLMKNLMKNNPWVYKCSLKLYSPRIDFN